MGGGRLMAAPTKLTPKVQETICAAIADGNYYEPACALAGIDYATFRRWMAEGALAKTGAKREFCDAVTRAEADAETAIVAMWKKHMPEDWAACRDFLARRHPGRWGSRDKHEHTGAGGGPLVISHIEVIPPYGNTEPLSDEE